MAFSPHERLTLPVPMSALMPRGGWLHVCDASMLRRSVCVWVCWRQLYQIVLSGFDFVCVLLHKSLCFKAPMDLCVCDSHLNQLMIWLFISVPNCLPTTVMCSWSMYPASPIGFSLICLS